MLLASRDLKASEIPGSLLRSLNFQQQKHLGKNITVLGSYPLAALFRESYGELDQNGNTQKNAVIKLGTFGQGAICDKLLDYAIGVNDTGSY